MTCEIECPKCGHVQEYDDDNDTAMEVVMRSKYETLQDVF